MSLDDVVRDRRVHPRLATRLPVRFSDFQYEWDGTCLSLSAGGCFIATGTGLPEDTDLDVDLVHPDGDALRVEGRVRWSREATSRVAGGLGIAFDFRKRGVLEALTDFVERLAVVDVKTATRFRAAGQPLPASTILYPARDAPPSPTLTTEERALLACVDGRASLHEIPPGGGRGPVGLPLLRALLPHRQGCDHPAQGAGRRPGAGPGEGAGGGTGERRAHRPPGHRPE